MKINFILVQAWWLRDFELSASILNLKASKLFQPYINPNLTKPYAFKASFFVISSRLNVFLQTTDYQVISWLILLGALYTLIYFSINPINLWSTIYYLEMIRRFIIFLMSYIASENPSIDRIQKKMDTQQPTREMYLSASLWTSPSSSWKWTITVSWNTEPSFMM